MIKLFISRYSALVLSLLLLGALVVKTETEAWKHTHELCFPLDDSYIHFAIAKHVAEDGTYGITPHGFSSTSSSPAYTLLLALFFKLFSVSLWIPLLINFIAAVAILFFVNDMFAGLNPWLKILILCTMVFVIPLAVMVVLGMEHTLHILLTLIFARQFTDYCMSAGMQRRKIMLLCVTAMLLVMFRYEGLFLVAVAAAILMFRKKRAAGFILLCSSLIPLAVYGLVSTAHGNYFLPNPVLVKSAFQQGLSDEGFREALLRLLSVPWYNTSVSFVFVPALFIFLRELLNGNSFTGKSQLLLFMFLCSALLHCLLAKIGWHYRYESYLIAFGIFSIAFSLVEKWNGNFRFKPTQLIVMFFFLPAFWLAYLRFNESRVLTPKAIVNIYDQQVQMGLFFKQHAERQAIIVNDIGAVNFFADIHCLDMEGLGSIEVTKAIINKNYGNDFFEKLVAEKKMNIAVIYDMYYPSFRGTISQWKKICEWKIQENVVCASDVVSFYAVNPVYAASLKKDLAEFEKKLPPNISVKYFFF